MTALPMFPLGTVLVPHLPLPLHVFAERYRVLTRRVLDGGGELGVVLIEQGSEVGGGDRRFDVGTVARVVAASELDDGRWSLMTLGTRRIRVVEWLPDDPHPHAVVEDMADAALSPFDRPALDRAERVVRRALALKAELDEPAAPFAIQLDPRPDIAAWQLVGIAPLGPLDRQRLLELPGPVDRLRHLASLVEEECEVLARRLSGG